jgi:hypothetical protein
MLDLPTDLGARASLRAKEFSSWGEVAARTLEVLELAGAGAAAAIRITGGAVAATIRDNFVFGNNLAGPVNSRPPGGVVLEASDGAVIEGNLLSGYLDIALNISPAARAVYVGPNRCGASARKCLSDNGIGTTVITKNMSN